MKFKEIFESSKYFIIYDKYEDEAVDLNSGEFLHDPYNNLSLDEIEEYYQGYVYDSKSKAKAASKEYIKMNPNFEVVEITPTGA